MTTSIEKVSGIGPATATLLADNGILSAEDLAVKPVGDLAAIKGFSSIRAGQVIEAAKQLTGIVVSDSPVQIVEPDKKDKGKKDKKKKKTREQAEKLPKNEKKKPSKAKKESSKKDKNKDKNKTKKPKKKSARKK